MASATAVRVALDAVVRARGEGRNLTTEGPEILAAAAQLISILKKFINIIEPAGAPAVTSQTREAPQQRHAAIHYF